MKAARGECSWVCLNFFRAEGRGISRDDGCRNGESADRWGGA